ISNRSWSTIFELKAWQLFDKWVAARVRRERPAVIVGYEVCCAETFYTAKSIGSTCVLDCAAVHYSLQDKVLPDAVISKNSQWGKRIRDRKERELDLADHVICVSDLAAESYRRAGVASERITTNPIGCDTSQFVLQDKSKDQAVRFAFVGVPGPV